MVGDPDESVTVRGTEEEMRARVADLARQGAVPVEAMVEVAQSAEPAVGLERIINASSARRPANWAARAARAAATVCRIRTQQDRDVGIIGTGFLVSPDLLLTAGHLLPDVAAAGAAVAEFTVDTDSDGAESLPQPVRYLLDPAGQFVTSQELDFTIVLVGAGPDRQSPGERFGWNRLSGQPGKILTGEPVNLIDFPAGSDKQIQVGGSSRLLTASDPVLQYLVDSVPGSSGAPVFNDQWDVVAMHHASRPSPDVGGERPTWRGEGIAIHAILDHLARLTPNRFLRALLAEPDPEARPAGNRHGRSTPASEDPADWITSVFGENPLVARLIEAARQDPDAYRDADRVREALRELVAADYARLEPVPARLLRRAALLGDDGVDPWIAGRLAGTDRDGAVAALAELTRAGLLVELSDGRRYFVHEAVRQYAHEQFLHADSVNEQDAAMQEVDRWRSGRDHRAEPKLTRDFWTTDDQLDHAPFADAIASFIQYQQTVPPLTIGIKAPWGAGKTSVLRMVQKRLDPGVGEDPFGPGTAGTREPRRIRLTAESRNKVRQNLDAGSRSGLLARLSRALLRRVRSPDTAAETRVSVAETIGVASSTTDVPPDKVRAELADEATNLAVEDWRATVWFNPWMYQSGEQVWAGLAHEIITQVTERLPVGDRERFWLRLNLARIDQEALRRRAYRAVALRALPFLAAIAVATLLAAAALLLAPLLHADWLRPVAAGVAATATGAGAVGATVRGVGFFFQAAAGPFGSLLRRPDIVGGTRTAVATELEAGYDNVLTDPDYGSKVGFLYLVQSDIRRVLDLVASERRPLVIFIDDIDRCSPGTVAQVMEAVNLFLAGEFPNCIFVVAMEPAVVAAHIEVAYRQLVTVQRQHDETDGSTLGWRFLEKIVQLPLSLPSARDRVHLVRYARGLLGLGWEKAQPGPTSTGTTVTPDADGAQPAGPGPGRPAIPASPSDEATARAGEVTAPGSTSGTPDRTPDPVLIQRLVTAIRAHRPTARNLREVASQTQDELVPSAGVRELLPETRAAVESVFREIYRDEDAADALAAALPGLGWTTPREIKRYLNLFRFFTFIVGLQRLDPVERPSSEQVAKLAALAIRWPHLVFAISGTFTGGTHPLEGLEEASRTEDGWAEALARFAGIAPATHRQAPPWHADVRRVLAEGPRIGALARLLL
jgi:V8-like Glu-specific endopeptidase